MKTATARKTWTRESYSHPTRGEAELAYRFSGATLEHIVVLSGDDFNTVHANLPTVEKARDHWRYTRQLLKDEGFTREETAVDTFKQGQSVWVRMPSGAEEKGAVVRLPGQTFGEQGETLAADRYRVRYWDNAEPNCWYHVTVGPDRLRARD